MASVRGSRTVYRGDDSPARTSRYTTVTRYQVPDNIAHAVRDDAKSVNDEKVIIRRYVRGESPPERDSRDFSVHESVRVRDRDAPSTREREEIDIRISERERERSPQTRVQYRVSERDRDSDYDRPARSTYRVVERDRERSTVRAPSPPTEERERVYRFERERSFSRDRERDRDYDVERYSKSTEYFAQPQPQPIIIRESAPQPQPIIIREERREPQKIIITREERREPQYEFVERREVEETRSETKSLVKREPTPEPEPVPVPAPEPEKKPEEDYFYERRIVERRRRSDSYDRKTEIRPRDSASQYSSDDSYEYVRREKVTEDGYRDRSPHHRRHLAEGAIAGIGAAEILRHHRRAKGEPAGGRGKSLVGGAAVGALGAEALSRVKSMRSLRDRDSRSRSRSDERHDRRDDRRRKRRSRSRSKSLSRAQQLGGLAAVAAVGALAGYALKNRGNKETVIVNDGRRRSRSRRRRSSVDSFYDREHMRDESKHRDPEHRNRRIAQAGLASAAAAGILERVRSKSRGGKGRSKSRVRQGVPIAAAGLGGAALAGLYEKNKANKEAKKDAIIQDEMNRGRRRRSRSRSRSVPASAYDDRRRIDDGGPVAYGSGPIPPEGYGGREIYSDEEPGSYRRRGGSSGSSPDTRRRRSRSRGHGLAEAGAAAGVAGLAAHEIGKRRERSRADKERRRQDDHYDRYSDAPYSPPPVGHNGYLPPQQNAPYGQQPQSAYPGGNFFPPPPTADFARNEPYAEQNAAYAPYNPADYAGQAPQQQSGPYQATHGAYGDSDAHLGQGYPTDTFAGDPRYGPQDHHPDDRRGRNPENVSSPLPSRESQGGQRRRSQSADSVEHTPRRGRSTSRVRFNLDQNTAHSPNASQRKDDAKRSDSASSDERPQTTRGLGDDDDDRNDYDEGGRKHRRRKRKGNKDRERDRTGLMHDTYDRSPDRASESTVDLPERFDEHGNHKQHDPLAEKINDLLAGKGGAGGIFKSIAEGFMGGGGGSGSDERDDDSRSGRRRSRR